MAEAIARDMLEKRGSTARVSSAGSLGIVDHPASENSVKAIAEIGLDLSSHRSQAISASYLKKLSAIVVMSEHHVSDIRAMARKTESKICRLWEHTTKPGRLDDINDPVGCRFPAFLSCRDDIVECLGNWLPGFVESWAEE